MQPLDECQRPLTRDVIKYIAMFTMLLNHIADIFLQTGTWLCEIFTAVGYFTAISMIYFLVEGYDYTHSKKKYFLRLMIFGLISEIPYCLALTTEGIISFCGLNMMFTLSLCFGLIWILDNMKSTIIKVIFIVLFIGLSVLCSWAILAPIYTLLFIWAKSSGKRGKIAFAISTLLFGCMNFLGGIEHFTTSENILYALLSMIGMGVAGFCILYLYNGKQAVKGKKFSKWFFYTFYPTHLLILGMIRIISM